MLYVGLAPRGYLINDLPHRATGCLLSAASQVETKTLFHCDPPVNLSRTPTLALDTCMEFEVSPPHSYPVLRKTVSFLMKDPVPIE